jgi:CRISPR/Cas system-associated protein Cas10 (large subunit of type III CRISPR-Cas system)
MKPFMKTCYKCKNNVKIATCIKENIELNCMKCTTCGEEYFTSSELLKFDILSGKKSLVRKFGELGDSIIMRMPPKVLKDYKIQSGDYALFEEKPDGILIKLIRASELS